MDIDVKEALRNKGGLVWWQLMYWRWNRGINDASETTGCYTDADWKKQIAKSVKYGDFVQLLGRYKIVDNQIFEQTPER